jgi:hypothetical protein
MRRDDVGSRRVPHERWHEVFGIREDEGVRVDVSGELAFGLALDGRQTQRPPQTEDAVAGARVVVEA